MKPQSFAEESGFALFGCGLLECGVSLFDSLDGGFGAGAEGLTVVVLVAVQADLRRPLVVKSTEREEMLVLAPKERREKRSPVGES